MAPSHNGEGPSFLNMKIIIIGKRNQLGTMDVINLKGMSRMLYKFEWDPEIQAYGYEPKNQKEADDIFDTQGRLYKTMRFSVKIDEEKKEECPKCVVVEKPVKKKRGRPKKKAAV